MKKFSFTIRGNKYDVELQSIEDNIAEIEVNGSKYEVEIHKEKMGISMVYIYLE